MVPSLWTGDNPTARPCSRVILVQLLVKTVLTIAFVILAPMSSMRIVLIILLLLGTGLVASLYSWSMPHYRFDYNVLRAASFWILTWSACCLLILEISASGSIACFLVVISLLLAHLFEFWQAP